MTVTRELDSRMWTNRLRTRFFGTFPPDKLLPDRQPAYVASWIYVFGVATIAALRRPPRPGGHRGLRTRT